MSREEWLSVRRKTIGGSDAAGIVGLSKYESQYSIWVNKMGLLPDKEDTESMRQGRDLEEYVAQRWAERTGRMPENPQAIYYNSDFPFAHANPDRWVQGENAGLECKTTSTLDLKQFNGVDFPEKYYVQCVHYLAVTGADKWYLGVLVFGRGFFTFELDRDQAEIDALMQAEAEFWKLVESQMPPPMDGTRPTEEALETVFPTSNGENCELFGRNEILEEFFSLKDQEREIEERMTEIKNIIKSDMGETENACSGDIRCTWKTQRRKTFQARAFAADHPEIQLDTYYRETTVRPFKIEKRERTEDF